MSICGSAATGADGRDIGAIEPGTGGGSASGTKVGGAGMRLEALHDVHV